MAGNSNDHAKFVRVCGLSAHIGQASGIGLMGPKASFFRWGINASKPFPLRAADYVLSIHILKSCEYSPLLSN